MQTFLIVVVGWIITLCLHEFSHALAAYLGGDHSVARNGYLTNPLRYIHPVYSLLMPLIFIIMGGIGLPGGAMRYNPGNLRSRAWETVISYAGPASSLGVVFALAAALRQDWALPYAPALAFLGVIVLSAALFSLLPIPPMDGFQIVRLFLSPRSRAEVDSCGNTAIWIVLFAMWYIPFLSMLYWEIIDSIAYLIGIPYDTAMLGYTLFRFWS